MRSHSQIYYEPIVVILRQPSFFVQGVATRESGGKKELTELLIFVTTDFHTIQFQCISMLLLYLRRKTSLPNREPSRTIPGSPRITTTAAASQSEKPKCHFLMAAAAIASWLTDAYSQIFRSYVCGPSVFWTIAPLRCAAKYDPSLSLDCAPTPSTLAQSKERKGSNFAIWQH